MLLGVTLQRVATCSIVKRVMYSSYNNVFVAGVWNSGILGFYEGGDLND